MMENIEEEASHSESNRDSNQGNFALGEVQQVNDSTQNEFD